MKRSSVRLSIGPIIRPQQRRAVGLLLSAVWAGDIDRRRQAPGAQQHGAQQGRIQKMNLEGANSGGHQRVPGVEAR